MLFKVIGGVKRSCATPCALRLCVEELIGPDILRDISFSHLSSWSPDSLCATALMWVWSDESTLIRRFEAARRIATKGFQPPAGLSHAYQPFMRMMVRQSPKLFFPLIREFRRLMETRLRSSFREFGFAVIAVDGTRFEVPRTESNLQAFAAREDNGKTKRRRKKTRTRSDLKKSVTPQVWLTTAWHVGTGLPWAWRYGKSGSSERQHLLDMLPELPENSLITADAGYGGYEYWKTIVDSGHHFIIRAAGGTELWTHLERDNESPDYAYLWPKNAQNQELPPIKVRIVTIQRGKKTIHLVTSVLSKEKLSDKQVKQISKKRWGIEVYYRTVKQSFQRRKLRSNSATHARLELEWSLLGLWAVCLFGQLQPRPKGLRSTTGLPPLSPIKLLSAIRLTMREYKCVPDNGEDLWTLVSLAVKDDNRRKRKESYDYPRKKQRDATKPPIIKRATAELRRLAGRFKDVTNKPLQKQG